jgi:hypothetical protein
MTDHTILDAIRTGAKVRPGCERHNLDAAVNAIPPDADISHGHLATVAFDRSANLLGQLIDQSVDAAQWSLNLLEASKNRTALSCG